jgi:Holliday junction resolvasome RuvABC endonuclease subunit
MKILALDISTKSTGWFVSKEACGLIKIEPELELSQKLVQFRKVLIKLLMEHKPKVVVIEDVHYRRGFSNIHTVKLLSKFGGVASEAAASKKAKVVLLTATAARKSLGLEGKVTKEDVFNYFNTTHSLGWSFKEHNDITDAWMLHFAHCVGNKE